MGLVVIVQSIPPSHRDSGTSDVPPLVEIQNAAPPPRRTPWGNPHARTPGGVKGARRRAFVSSVNDQGSRDALCPLRKGVPPPSSGQVLAEPSGLAWAARGCGPVGWRWLAAYPRVARKEWPSATNAACSRYRCEVGRVGVSHGCIHGARVQDSWVASAQAMYRRGGSLTDRIILLALGSRPSEGRYEKEVGEQGSGMA